MDTSPLLDELEASAATPRPITENLSTSAVAALATAGAGEAEGTAADDDDPEVEAGKRRLATKFADLALRWLRALRNPPTPTPRTLLPLNADSFAAAAAAFADEVAGSSLDAEAEKLAAAARHFAAAKRDVSRGFDLVRAAVDLSNAATGTAFAIQSSDLLVSVSCLVVIPKETKTETLVRSSREFVIAAQGSSMDEVAKQFAGAVDAFAAGKFRSMKIGDTELCKVGQTLQYLASNAPDTEKNLAAKAGAIVGESSILQLEDKDPPRRRRTRTRTRTSSPAGRACLEWLRARLSPPACFEWLRDRLSPPACFEWLRARLSAAPTPALPLHRHEVKRQAKIADKRTFIFGLTLSTPVALLTTMKVESVLSAGCTAWIGGASAAVWLCVNGGSLMNLYGESNFEQRAAQHLSRLGMLGLAIQLCLFMYLSFFPLLPQLFWTLVGFAASLHGTLWIVGCCRHDDDSTYRLSGDNLCMCPLCNPSCNCCSKRGSVVVHPVDFV